MSAVRARAWPSYICEYVRETKWQYLISISYFRLPCLVWSPDHARDERFPFLGSDLSDSSRRRAAQSTSHPRLHTRLCGRRAGLWASQSSQGVMRWWDSRLIHEPTTSADAVVVKRSPKPFSRAAASALPEGASEPQDESVRAAGGTLGIPELTRWHTVVGQSPDP